LIDLNHRFDHKLQEQNSSRFNSQKENMMQAVNVKQVTKPELANNAINQSLIEQSKKVDVKVVEAADANKTASFNRFLEAYSDCV
jgi:hypothetical protein